MRLIFRELLSATSGAFTCTLGGLVNKNAGNYKEELMMRDIRADLQERLEGVVKDREELKRRIAELEPIEFAIKAVLQRESENFTAPHSTPMERNVDCFGATDAVASLGTKQAGDGFGGKDRMVNYAPNDAIGGVKPSHWGEYKVG